MTTVSTPIDAYGLLSMVTMGALADPVFPPNSGQGDASFSLSLSADGGVSAELEFVLATDISGHASATPEITFELWAYGGRGRVGRINRLLKNPFTVSARGGSRASQEMGPPTLDASATVTNIGRLVEIIGIAGDPGDRDLRFTITATGSPSDVARMTAIVRNAFDVTARSGGKMAGELPAFTIDAQAEQGNLGRMSASMRFAPGASGVQGTIGRAVLEIPAFELVYNGRLSALMPAFTIAARGSLVDAAADGYAYAINVATGETTRYTNFAFDYLLRFEGETIGVTSDGLFLLGGNVDELVGDVDPAQIAATVELAPSDFGTSRLKRLPYVYLGVKSGAALKVTAATDSGVPTSALTTTTGRNRRAKLARGPKGRFWRVKIENRNGEDFALDAAELLPMQIGRKV